jgi:hypothetical protein
VDSLVLKKGQMLEIHNKVYLIMRDTVFVIPASVKYSVKANKGDLFYSNLEKRLDKRKWTKELHNVIIAPNHKNNSIDSLTTSPATNQFILYEGRPIRHIKLQQLDVFGPTILNPSGSAGSWVERTGNKLHFKSKKYLINNNLLFKEGDLVDTENLADNERVLRALPYLEDALIKIQTVGELNDSVDVMVITKDVWSKAFDIDVNNIYSGKVLLWDRNILGFGHESVHNWLRRELPDK